MPFVRFSRDARGFNHIFLMDVPGRGSSARPRILFWHCTPAGVKMVREPFDEAVQRELEAHYPHVVFDWPKIVAARMPPPAPDVERWRERRRANRAERLDVQKGDTTPVSPDVAGETAPVAAEPSPAVVPPQAAVGQGTGQTAGQTGETTGQTAGQGRSRRRRRRGGRGGGAPPQVAPPDRG